VTVKLDPRWLELIQREPSDRKLSDRGDMAAEVYLRVCRDAARQLDERGPAAGFELLSWYLDEAGVIREYLHGRSCPLNPWADGDCVRETPDMPEWLTKMSIEVAFLVAGYHVMFAGFDLKELEQRCLRHWSSFPLDNLEGETTPCTGAAFTLHMTVGIVLQAIGLGAWATDFFTNRGRELGGAISQLPARVAEIAPHLPGLDLELKRQTERCFDRLIYVHRMHFEDSSVEPAARRLARFDPADVERVRKAVANLGVGAKRTTIYRAAGINNTTGGQILRCILDASTEAIVARK
jgi:hypothetical protein